MLTYEDALDRLLAAAVPLDTVDVPLGDSCGRFTAANVVARLTQPPFAASAMDGYAVRWADFPGPWTVVGESAAGKGFGGIVGAHEAVRIFTGAAVPDGSDTVVVQEDTVRADGALRLTGEGPPARGAHIRAAGKDFRVGDTLIVAGTQITPQHIGLAAAAGHGSVTVRRLPRVALLATGNELVPPGTLPAADQIVSSNGVMLAALLHGAGAEVRDIGILRDDLAAITAAIRDAASADIVITIGGASVGDHDYVQRALVDAGAKIDFWKVAIKPGKPLIAGEIGQARVLGLPGNPVSAFVCAALFALPMLRRMAGAAGPVPTLVNAPLLEALPANGNRRDHIRARLTANGVTPFGAQDSSMLGVLAASNALIVRPAGAAAAKVGDLLPVLPLDMPYSTP